MESHIGEEKKRRKIKGVWTDCMFVWEMWRHRPDTNRVYRIACTQERKWETKIQRERERERDSSCLSWLQAIKCHAGWDAVANNLNSHSKPADHNGLIIESTCKLKMKPLLCFTICSCSPWLNHWLFSIQNHQTT